MYIHIIIYQHRPTAGKRVVQPLFPTGKPRVCCPCCLAARILRRLRAPEFWALWDNDPARLPGCCLLMQSAKAQNGGVVGRLSCNPCWAWLQSSSSSEFPAGIFATGAFGGACHRHRMLPPSHSIRPKQNHGDIW